MERSVILKKNKIERLKTRQFIIIEIKNIFKSGINGGRLTARIKTKTFGDVWIKTKKKKNLETKIKIIGTNIISKLSCGKGDVSLRHSRHHLTEAN